MNLAHEKILEALKNSDEPLTQYDLADIRLLTKWDKSKSK